MKRVYIDSSGPDHDSAKKIVKEAIDFSISNNTKKIIFLNPTLDNVDWLREIFNDKIVKAFKDGYKDNQGIHFSIDSKRTFEDYGNDCVLVVYGLPSENIFELEDVNRIKGIFAIPWVKGECDGWASSMGAIELNSNSKSTSVALPCVVEKALDQLDSVNKQTLHSSDKERIKTYIRALNKYNYPLNTDGIKAYLYKNNWDKSSVNYLINLVNKVNDGGYFQGGSKTGLKKFKDKWETECVDT